MPMSPNWRAMLIVPSPPMQKSTSRPASWKFFRQSSERSSAFDASPPGGTYWNGCAVLEVPRMVPPWVRMPLTFS